MADMGSDTDTEWEGDMAALDSTPPPPPVPRATGTHHPPSLARPGHDTTLTSPHHRPTSVGVEPVGDELV